MSLASGDPRPRFWASVDKTDSCWNWTGALRRDYGRFYITTDSGGITVAAHRYAYEILVGPIPPGLDIDHLCRNKRCVNPAHLEPVTERENVLRGVSVPALNARKTHCLRGHEFTPENTNVVRGRRVCRTCHRATKRALRQAGRL